MITRDAIALSGISYSAADLLEGSLQTRVQRYKQEVASVTARKPALDAMAFYQATTRLRQVFGLTLQDIAAVEFGTPDEEAANVPNTDCDPVWLTPSLLAEAELQAQGMPDYAISERCGEVTVCPIHKQEYTIVTGDLCQDCTPCFEDKAKREVHAQASAMARQGALERSGVEEPVPTLAQQQAERWRTARMLLTAPALAFAVSVLATLAYAYTLRHGG